MKIRVVLFLKPIW